MRAWEKNSTKRGEEKTLLGQSLRRLEMQARNQNQGSRLIRDTFPLHFLLAIKLYCVILTCCQWHPEENLLNLKVFLSSPLVRARFFPNLSSRVITRVFSQALIIDFSKKRKEFQIFGGVSNLVFIVLCRKFPELRTIPVRESFQSVTLPLKKPWKPSFQLEESFFCFSSLSHWKLLHSPAGPVFFLALDLALI
jgi:hypothetical protein